MQPADERFYVGERRRAGLGETDAARRAIEEPQVEVFFKLADRVADCQRRDTERGRRRGEAACFRPCARIRRARTPRFMHAFLFEPGDLVWHVQLLEFCDFFTAQFER